MDTAENTPVPKVASQRYQTTLEEYKEALLKDATISFFSFCRGKHVNYDGIKKWASAKGVSIMALKREAMFNVKCHHTKKAIEILCKAKKVADSMNKAEKGKWSANLKSITNKIEELKSSISS